MHILLSLNGTFLMTANNLLASINFAILRFVCCCKCTHKQVHALLMWTLSSLDIICAIRLLVYFTILTSSDHRSRLDDKVLCTIRRINLINNSFLRSAAASPALDSSTVCDHLLKAITKELPIILYTIRLVRAFFTKPP